jgi:hypothetical protein
MNCKTLFYNKNLIICRYKYAYLRTCAFLSNLNLHYMKIHGGNADIIVAYAVMYEAK